MITVYVLFCFVFKGYYGDFCEFSQQIACTSSPCVNGGTCINDMSTVGFKCLCLPMWTGQQCEIYDGSSTTTSISLTEAKQECLKNDCTKKAHNGFCDVSYCCTLRQLFHVCELRVAGKIMTMKKFAYTWSIRKNVVIN